MILYIQAHPYDTCTKYDLSRKQYFPNSQLSHKLLPLTEM